MNTQRFTTLTDLYNAVGENGQVTAQQIINERINLVGQGWTNVEVSSNLKVEVAEIVSELLGGFKKTKESVRFNLLHTRPQHWGLDRIILCKRGERMFFSYCAGQDYPSEIKTIRNAVK